MDEYQFWGRAIALIFQSLKTADADGAAGVNAEDFVEGIDHRRSRRDDQPAEDGHLALVHVAAPDGEAAVDDREDAQDETEHHDYGQAVADAGLQIGGTEGGALGEGGNGVECEQGRNGEERAVTVQESDALLHIFVCVFWLFILSGGFFRRVTRVIISNFQTRFVPFWNKMKKSFWHDDSP